MRDILRRERSRAGRGRRDREPRAASSCRAVPLSNAVFRVTTANARAPRSLSPRNYCSLRELERRGSKILFELQARYAKRKRGGGEDGGGKEGGRREGRRRRWRRVAGGEDDDVEEKKSRTMLLRTARLASPSAFFLLVFFPLPAAGQANCASRVERCLKLNITRAERLRALKRYDSDNEERSKALLCAPDDYGR